MVPYYAKTDSRLPYKLCCNLKTDRHRSHIKMQAFRWSGEIIHSCVELVEFNVSLDT